MFVSAAQALDMLAAHGPRAWAKRVLCWEVYAGSLSLYFASGETQETRLAFSILADATEGDVLAGVDEVRAKFGEQMAGKVAKAGFGGRVLIATEKWAGEARLCSGAVLLYADSIDWNAGSLTATFDDTNMEELQRYGDVQPQSGKSELSLALGDMCFDLRSLEMLAPGAEPPRVELLSLDQMAATDGPPRRGGPGRRREYDWDGALLFLIGQAEMNSIAQDPDAHGAQADLARLLGDWFLENGGKIPADSQLQSYAKRALGAIRSTAPKS
jgi:hypothetical protein